MWLAMTVVDRFVCACRRDREDQEREIREAEEREALKNMTDAERRAWEAAHPKVCHLINISCCHIMLPWAKPIAIHLPSKPQTQRARLCVSVLLALFRVLWLLVHVATLTKHWNACMLPSIGVHKWYMHLRRCCQHGLRVRVGATGSQEGQECMHLGA